MNINHSNDKPFSESRAESTLEMYHTPAKRLAGDSKPETGIFMHSLGCKALLYVSYKNISLVMCYYNYSIDTAMPC